jgi:S-adenosylmethionine:tRNA ribosyltransferase-isomerase
VDLRTADFDYPLPPERIAQTPVEPRDASRLLVVHRNDGAIEHRHFRDIGEYLLPGDLLVANDSRVLPGRLWARKPSGGRVELLLLRPLDDRWWEALARPINRLRPGQRLTLISAPEPDQLAGSRTLVAGASPLAPLADTPRRPAIGPVDLKSPADQGAPVEVELGERTPVGALRVRFDAPLEVVIARFGHVPLPPYIHTPLADPERYQTVYARVTGSAAAPTAGLHFTPTLLDTLAGRGIGLAFVTLHVGSDTFRPVRADRIVEHQMHAEFAAVPAATARAIAATRQRGGRVVAIGTTAVRTLESWAAQVGPLLDRPPAGDWSDWTRLFIYPGYRFRVVDVLITNFHLPRSTLLMLLAAFAGRDLMQRAYATAIACEYRFYSFGDACLFL